MIIIQSIIYHLSRTKRILDSSVEHQLILFNFSIDSSSISNYKRLHLSKRTSSTPHIGDDDDESDIDGYGNSDFGNFNEYSDNNGDHIDVMDGGINNQPPIVPKGLPTKFMMRGMRGQRQYDVPQIGKSFSITFNQSQAASESFFFFFNINGNALSIFIINAV